MMSNPSLCPIKNSSQRFSSLFRTLGIRGMDLLFPNLLFLSGAQQNLTHRILYNQLLAIHCIRSLSSDAKDRDFSLRYRLGKYRKETFHLAREFLWPYLHLYNPENRSDPLN